MILFFQFKEKWRKTHFYPSNQMLYHQQKTTVRVLGRAILHFHLIREMLDTLYIEHTTEVSPYRVLVQNLTLGTMSRE